MDGTARTLLDEIREGQRRALGEIVPDDRAPDCVTELVTSAVPRLLAALDGVLKAAADWQRYASEGDAQDECALEIRKAVARELAGSATPGQVPVKHGPACECTPCLAEPSYRTRREVAP